VQREEEAASSLENSDTKRPTTRGNKIGCEEEEQQQEETAANRYPPVIIPGIISIRHSLRVFYQINAHMKALQMNSISLPNTIIKHMHEHIKFTWNTLEITYPT
jgi:hypothetical protein